MKNLFFTGLLMLIFSIMPTQLFSQTQSKTINVNTSWNGRMCNGGHGMCYIDSSSNKSASNTQVRFDKASKELIFVFSKTTLDSTNKEKLLSNKLEKDFYLYTFEEDFALSKALKEALNIKAFNKIKKGNYLVKIVKDQIIMKLKLE